MIFNQGMDDDEFYVDLEGQGHRSKVKVARSENMIFGINIIFAIGRITHFNVKLHDGFICINFRPTCQDSPDF